MRNLYLKGGYRRDGGEGSDGDGPEPAGWGILVTDLGGGLAPFPEGPQTLFAHQVESRDLALAQIEGDFVVDKRIVKADGGGILPVGGEVEAAEAGPINSTQAHRARFATGVDFAIF